jgi:hypothetical protein
MYPNKCSMKKEREHERGRVAPFPDLLHITQEKENGRLRGALKRKGCSSFRFAKCNPKDGAVKR